VLKIPFREVTPVVDFFPMQDIQSHRAPNDSLMVLPSDPSAFQKL
jgi:hypothetical protein